MNIKPLSDRVVVKPIDPEKKRQSGIIIPDTVREKPQEGEVIAVGPGKVDDEGRKVPMEVKKGNKVLYGKYSGTEITIDGTEYLIMRASDILAIV
jgi:chaperonin GroES